jgi:hypothetical protein
MEDTVSCPKCRQPAGVEDYFCHNCGHILRPRPLSSSVSSLIVLFLKTALLPPLGLFWGWQYLRQRDSTSKIVGYLVIAVTVVELVWLTQTTITAINTANQTINQQFQQMGL